MDLKEKLAQAGGEEEDVEGCLVQPPTSCPPRRRLDLIQRTAYGVGHVLNDVCAAMWFSYTLLFFQVILGMPPLLAGAMLLIGQVADALATPIVGIFADRSGSRKTWHVIGTCLVIASFPLIFSPCPGCQDPTPTVYHPPLNATQFQDLRPWSLLSVSEIWLRGLYYAAVIVLFQTGWAIVQISHLALIPDLTPIQDERAELTAIRYTASVSASVFMYLTTWAVLHATAANQVPIGPADAYKFRDIVVIGLACGGIFSGLFHWVLKTPQTVTTLQNICSTSDHLTPTKHNGDFFRQPVLYKVSVLYVASRLFVTLSLVYMPLYLVESLGEVAESLATIPLVSYIASFLAALIVKQCTHFIGSKTMYLFGSLICIIACTWIGIGIGRLSQTGELYGLATLIGFGSSVTTVSSLCLTADLIGTHNKNGAFVYSLVTFADKLLNGIVVVFIEEIKCDNHWQCPHYYRDVLAFACGGSALLGLAALSTLHRQP